MFKGIKRKELFVLLILVVFAGFVRFYRFSDRINFGPEQAISVQTSAEYLSKKFTFLGQPAIIRNTSNGFAVFQGAMFSYSLIPLQLIFHYDTLPTTAFFAVLNIFTGLVLYFLVRRRFGLSAALISATLFLFNDFMIVESLHIWIINYSPLLGLLIFDVLAKKEKKMSPGDVLLVGLLCGASFALEYAFLFFAIPILIYALYRSKNIIKSFSLFLLGAVIPNLPTIVFDLRHNFFHLRTLWQYAQDVFSGKADAALSYYHFFCIWPVLCIAVAICLMHYLKKPVLIGTFIAVYLFFNLTSRWVSFTDAVGMPHDLRYDNVLEAAKTIADEHENNFNVVSFFDFDTTATALRYLLEYQLRAKPLDNMSYDQASTLYIFTPSLENYQNSPAIELKSFKDLPPEHVATISGRYQLYKITK